MPYRFVVYIDESGDEGFVFRDPPEKGSSDWFILSATITSKEDDERTRELAASIRTIAKLQTRQELHFADLDHEQCVPAIQAIAQSHVTVSSVLVNKRAIQNPAIFQEAPFRLYYYAARLLLERVSWFCRDIATARGWPSPLARVIFEHRKHLSYDSLKAYLNILRGQAQMDAWQNVLMHDIRIHWPALDNHHIEPARKAQYGGLQISDLVSGSLRWALEDSAYGCTEHRYAKTLAPVTYRRNRNYLSYGLKFFPEGVTPQDPRGHWVRKHYT